MSIGDDTGAGDVIARMISDSMRVPFLDYVRGQVSTEEFRQILEIAQGAIESTKDRETTPLVVYLGLKLAAEMYEQGALGLAALVGRGNASN